MSLGELAFWSSTLLVIYAYFGYPLLLLIASRLFARETNESETLPEVSILIPVHNQADTIREKIENTIALNYPEGRKRIIVSSDGSDDGTDEVVRSFESEGVSLVSSAERGGKVAAQLRALPELRGEVAVFTDASILLEADSLLAIVRPFSDRSVGCVSSEDHVPGGGEGLYVRYEMALRRLEGRLQTLIGVSGSFYAVRATLVAPTDPRYTRDFLVPLTIIEKGYRVLSAPGAQGHFLPAPSAKSEFHRKVRTVMRGMDVLFKMRHLMNPFRRPFVAWALFSHKVVRWLVPVGLGGAFIFNLFLLGDPLYQVTALLQLLLYGFASGAVFSSKIRALLPAKAALFFLVTNAAVFLAWIRYIGGERAIVWEPTKR